ncbi:hypothetical protein RND71_007425 [Anisodus tanguticus]|uniref:Carotenoid cleavage dioxygenase 7 n=1 Tax=Anisodus tanguticus TaxID=243964 RepID=A0AAE1VPR5_9SOLA|nr:hypothetical protein RND71_007425 [Anisodus tanguticus]
MQAKACHNIIPPKLLPPTKLPSTASQIKLPSHVSRAITITTSPTHEVYTPEIDDTITAFWDYQFLFVSQRSETTEPINLRVVEGSIPSDFPSGTYYLTGPGLFADDHGSTVHPLDGHGYLRTFEIDGGTGQVKFMARYIETEAQAEERDPVTGKWRFTHRGPFSVLKGGKMVGNTKVMKNVANTSVLQWGGRLFCLWEGGDPYEIDSKTLNTVGKFELIKNNSESLPEERKFNGDFLDVAAQILKPILYEFDSNFQLLQSQEFEIPDHLMIHDWAFTDTHYILFGNRIKLDIPGSMTAVCGLSPMISALSVNPSKQTSPIYLLPRFPNKQTNVERDWRKPIDAPSQMWVLHVGNAFEEIDVNGNVNIEIQASGCSYQWFNFQKMFGYDWQSGKLDPAMMNVQEGEEKLLPHLVQVSINLDTNENCTNCSVNDLNPQWNKAADFPAMNPEFSGRKNEYVYAATSSGSRQALPHFPFDTVVKLNTADKSVQKWSAGRRRFIGEPVFIPRGTKEDDGYLLVVEYAVSTQRCYLVILDAQRIGEKNEVVARLEVPRHLNFPLGFHGFWAPNNSAQENLPNFESKCKDSWSMMENNMVNIGN